MSQDEYRFRYEAYKNNTFDLDVVEKSLDESKMSGYQYLRKFQLDSTGYKRFDFGMQDIYRTYNINHKIVMVPRRWVFFIEHEFINVGNRLAYKRSNLYEKDLGFDQIISRPDLFDSTFLVFINGKLYTKGVKVLCKEDKTYIIFLCREKPSEEGFSIGEMREYIKTNAKVSIYFIPNTGIKNISTNAYRVRTLNRKGGMPTRNLDLTDYVDYNNALSFLRHDADIVSTPAVTNIQDNGLYVNEDVINDIIQKYPDNTAIDIQLIPLRNMLSRMEVSGTKWFEIPMQDYPVAIENCLIMDEDGLFVHDARIKHYYPNIYSIDNIDDMIGKKKLYVYTFYFENKVDKLKHLDMLAAYHKYVPDYLERYENGTINPMVRDFNPRIVEYSIKNYRKGLVCNDNVMATYLKSSDGNVYKITINNYKLITDIQKERMDVDCPEYFYILDESTSYKYKMFMKDDNVYTMPYEFDVESDIVYIYDNTAKMHTKLATENGVLALFEFLHYTDHFKYKIIKMREFIKADVNNFRRYLRNLGLGNNYYYVDVAKVDLRQRKRIDNSDTKLRPFTFDKEMYMFVFRNDFRGMYDDLIIHVDGTRYDKEIQIYRTTMLDYVYIPCELVKPDTVLEIEKVCDTKKDIFFESEHINQIVKIDIGDIAVRNKTLFNDLFVVDRETGLYLNKDDYQIILPVKFHMDDIESDIVLDYIITETDNGYYQMVLLDHGLIEIYRDDDPEDIGNAHYLSMQSDNNKFYEFDMVNNKAVFNNVEELNGYAVNKLRDMNNKNLVYQFKMIDGAVRIEISEDNGANPKIAEGGFNIVDIEDVFLTCPRDVKVKITNPEYLNRKLVFHIKKNHNVAYIEDIITEENKNDANFRPIPFVTSSKKDPAYFRIYQNGRLIPRHLGMVRFPIKDLDSSGEMFAGFVRQPGVDYKLVVESMPYRMKQVCFFDSIPNDQVINLKGKIDKPFDFKWYDIYLNGRKLVKSEVEIITANIIKILGSESLQNLEIIENTRDKEYFGGFENAVYDILDDIFENDKVFSDNLNGSVTDMEDNEEDIIEIPIDPIDFIIKAYFDYLTKNFGFINPDWLQISEDDIERFNEILSPEEPFLLGFDIMGSNRLDEERIALHINPDIE